MSQPDKQTADCYSVGDRRMMVWWAQLRNRTLVPLLRLMKRLDITANGVTFLGLLFGLAFVPLLLLGSPIYALLALLMHVLLDGLDGPLARYLGASSRAGSFTDTVCDQIIVAATTMALMGVQAISAVEGTVYLFVYTLVVVFSMIRNAMNVPYKFLIRPRFFVYLCIPIEFYLFPGSLNILVIVMIIPLTIAAIQGYRVIRKAL